MKIERIIILLYVLLICGLISRSQITIYNGSATAQELVNRLVGSGVTVSNVSFVGTTATAHTSNSPVGFFSGGTTALGMASGIVLSSGQVYYITSSNTDTRKSYDFNRAGDPDLNNEVGETTYDAIGLQFDFIPESDYIEFKYVFASEEYNEFVNKYNDVFAFYITSLEPDGYNYNKKNIAIVPGTVNTPVSINNVNKNVNSIYFRDNEGGNIPIECDGLTTVLTASCAVKACKKYRMKLVIADTRDRILDSYCFFKEGSLISPQLDEITTSYSLPSAGSNGVEGCNNIIATFRLQSPAPSTGRKIAFTIGGTAIKGTDYICNPNFDATWNTYFPNKYYVNIPAGATSTSITIIPLYDGITESDESITITADRKMCSTSTVSGTVWIKDKSPLVANILANPVYACNGVPGSVIQASGSGGWPNPNYTYAWSPATGLSATNVANPTATITANTTYTVTVGDACNHTATNTVNVQLYHQGGQIGLWIGNVSSDWNNCANWGNGKVPDATIDAVIPSNATYWPVKNGLTVGTDCKSLTIKNNGQITINGNLTINSSKYFTCEGNATIYVSGNWVDNGTFARGTSTVIFNGTNTQYVNQGINKDYSFWNVIIDGADVRFYYNSASQRRINVNDIVINNGKKLQTYRQ